MRMNLFKNIRLSTQLFALVARDPGHSGRRSSPTRCSRCADTQGTLKHTIDNRMVSGQSIQGVADALTLSLEDSLARRREEAEPRAKRTMRSRRPSTRRVTTGIATSSAT